jgi:hypothetical protein
MTAATMDEAQREVAKAERFRRAARTLREWANDLRDDDRLLDEDAEEEGQNDDELAA